MAHRPNVWGVDFNLVNKQLGSKDQTLLKRLTKHLHEWIEPEDDNQKRWLSRADEVLERAINEGIPFSDCNVEGYGEVWAAVTLVEGIISESMMATNFGHWHTSALYKVDEQLGKRFDRDTRRYFAYMTGGRPMFGRKIETDWSFYACIRTDELKVFRSGLERTYAQCCEIIDKGYMNEQDFDSNLLELIESLMETQDELIDKKLDFWLYGN